MERGSDKEKWELLNLNVGDVDCRDDSIRLKPTPKRSNRMAFFDEKCTAALRRRPVCRERLAPGPRRFS